MTTQMMIPQFLNGSPLSGMEEGSDMEHERSLAAWHV